MHKSNIMKNDNAKIQGQFGFCKLSMKFFCLQLQIPSSFFVSSDGAYGNQGVLSSNGETSGDAKTKSRTLFRQERDGKWGKGKYKGKTS